MEYSNRRINIIISKFHDKNILEQYILNIWYKWLNK